MRARPGGWGCPVGTGMTLRESAGRGGWRGSEEGGRALMSGARTDCRRRSCSLVRGAWGWPLLLFFPPLGLLTENSSPRTRSNEQGG